MDALSHDSPPPKSSPSSLRRAWRIFKGTLVAGFVIWHLGFMAYRNFADLWGEEVIKNATEKKAQAEEAWTAAQDEHRSSRFSRLYVSLEFWRTCESLGKSEDLKEYGLYTRRYAAYAGQEQGWCMFAAPLARWAYFPAVRIYFTDGSEELKTSDNERDPKSYLRIGGWRQRKFEDTIAAGNANPNGEEAAMWKNYTLWVYRAWREAHPDDPREVKWLMLRRRCIEFPAPGQPREFAEPESSEIALYTPEGRWVR